jgi:Lrp/AsnC family transcriptional regulator, leucine-responsive regulatory protein
VSSLRHVDAVDRKLIEALRANARATYAVLARHVGLSAPAVHDRVGKLEAAGVITGYHAAVEPATLGLGVSALVGLQQGDRGDSDRIAEALRAMPEIEDCWFVAGEETFVVKVRVPDVAALEHTIGALARIRGVARTRTTVVLSTRFEGRVRTATDPGATPAPDEAAADE